MISQLISLSICAAAAYRLRGSPLAAAALLLAGLALLATMLPVLVVARGKRVPRGLTALSHVCGALGAFFLFVSFSL